MREQIWRASRSGDSTFTCPVTVESVRDVSRGFRRVAVCSDRLAAYRRPMPADAFKLLLPQDGSGEVSFPLPGADGIPRWPGGRMPPMRAYTVRRFDAAWLRLEFDVAVHGHGLSMTWLDAVRPGDVVGLAGMRHEFHAGDGVAHHLLVGDASALPAVAAIVDALDPTVEITAHLAVTDADDRKLLPQRDNLTAHWTVGEPQCGPGSELARAVCGGPRPGGRVQAWLAAEAGVVRELRRFALGELGVDRDDLAAAAYWRAGQDSTEVDEQNIERFQRAAAEGKDITDPDVVDAMEFAD